MQPAELKPYPAYKDSGVPWLGEVPAHWEVRRVRSIAQVINGATPASNRPEYWEGDISWLTPEDLGQLTSRYVNISARRITNEGYHACGTTLAPAGSLAISTRAPIGHIAILFSAACVNQGCRLLVPTETVQSGYLYYELEVVRPELESLGQGSTFTELSRAKLAGFTLAVPPLPEQTAIVRFLDHADRRIRRYIRAKQKLMGLLEEQKQALIHQAVTGQIDVHTGQPYPAYKPSGVEWLGDVPAHWRLVRLKDVARVQTGFTLGKDYRNARTISRPYLRVANVQTGRLDLTHVKSIDIPPDEADRATLLSGDVLMTEGGDIDKLGRGCVWRDEIPGCLHQNHIFAVRCRQSVLNPEFLAGLMASQHGRTYFQLTAKQTTNLASTNSNILRAFPIPLPLLEDQLSILHVISEETHTLTNLMSRTEREISLLREYRTRLIADVVTGKLDVREAVAALPEVDPLAAEETLNDTLDTDAV